MIYIVPDIVFNSAAYKHSLLLEEDDIRKLKNIYFSCSKVIAFDETTGDCVVDSDGCKYVLTPNTKKALKDCLQNSSYANDIKYVGRLPSHDFLKAIEKVANYDWYDGYIYEYVQVWIYPDQDYVYFVGNSDIKSFSQILNSDLVKFFSNYRKIETKNDDDKHSVDSNYNNNKNTKKENETMNINPNMNLDFGPCGDGIALSPYGLAIKNKDNWLTYNAATNQTVDVTGVIFPMKGMIWKIPAAISDIKPNDLIIHQNKAMYVTQVDGSAITAVDILASESKSIIPVTNIFGFNYVTRVVSFTSFMGNSMNPSPDQPFGNIMPIMLMSQLFNDDNDYHGPNDNSFTDLMKMSFMMNALGGNVNGNPFAGMFAGMNPTAPAKTDNDNKK